MTEIEIIGKVSMGLIKPRGEYELLRKEDETYLIERSTANYRILGRVVDIVAEKSEKIEEYRKRGYAAFKLEGSERMAVVEMFPLYQAGRLKRKILKE